MCQRLYTADFICHQGKGDNNVLQLDTDTARTNVSEYAKKLWHIFCFGTMILEVEGYKDEKNGHAAPVVKWAGGKRRDLMK